MRLIRSATVIGSPVTLLVAVVSDVMNGSMCGVQLRQGGQGGVGGGEVSAEMGQPGCDAADRFRYAGGVLAVEVGHERGPHRCRNIGHTFLEQCFDGELIMVASPTHISVGEWAFQYMYQTAGFARAAPTRLLSTYS